MSRAVTESEFKDWLVHPVTQEVMKILAARREQRRQDWEGGAYTDWTQEGMALTNVGNIGECKAYAFVMDLDYEAYLTEIDDDRKQVGTGTAGSSSVD